ncbi:unnamed protein product [Diamesa serratosioi]
MPAICESLSAALTTNLNSLKDDKNFDNQLIVSTKRVLLSKIEYVPVQNYNNTILNNLKTKYIVLKSNSSPLLNSNGQNGHNGATKTQQSNGGKVNGTVAQLPPPKKILFSRENVKVGWKNSERKMGLGSGMYNNGNTCYLNSTLQALYHVPAFSHWLYSDIEHREKSEQCRHHCCIICAMARTLFNTQGNNQVISPNLITQRLTNVCKHLTHGRQEDAHEFLRYLIEAMEKSYLTRFKNHKEFDQYTKETTPLNQILGGYLRSTVTCLSCHHASITFQHFEDMLLDISRVSNVDDALNGYFSKENLEDMGYKCESCKKRVSATKKFSLERAPAVMCIQLKRFSVMGNKLMKQIQISEYLNLGKYLAKAPASNQNYRYRLTSMVTHLGMQSTGGHYTAVGLAPNGNYYCYDDDRVRPMQIDQVLRTNAYVLFYELVTDGRETNENYTITSAMASNININGNGHLKLDIPTNGHQRTVISNGKVHLNGNTPPSKLENGLKPKPGFAKPMLPSPLLKQAQMKNNETPHSSGILMNLPGLTLGAQIKSTFVLNKNGGVNGKKETLSDEDESNKRKHKNQKPSLPNIIDDDGETCVKKVKIDTPLAVNTTTTAKPKSLVPYDDDDDEVDTRDEPKVVSPSGVWHVSDLKESGSPSKKGSTLENTKIVVTKASSSNGVGGNTNGHVNGVNGCKSVTNGNGVHHTNGVVTELQKLSHSGYGAPVTSWNGSQTNMEKELLRDRHDDKKRQHEDEEELEIDRGRVKKVKTHQENGREKNLPNPFQEKQNIERQYGYNKSSYGSYQRNENNDYNRYQNKPNGNSNFNGNGNGHIQRNYPKLSSNGNNFRGNNQSNGFNHQKNNRNHNNNQRNSYFNKR